ncbi:MAG TPA: response regulator [Bacillota bacterium]|nr:response regulator [Bacillota bacterium]
MGNDNEILTVNEVADYLRMNPMTIYRLAQQGKIPASKVLGCWRFSRREIETWLKTQEFQPSKILVIDDDSAIGVAIQNSLEKKHKILSVETAHEALGALEREKFSLIFLDLNLPDIDGLSLYKQLKNNQKNVPVVVITGSTDVDLLGKVVAEGVQFILNKPFTTDEVRQMLSFIKV